MKIKVAENAKYLFRIHASIPRDGSQGVGEVKIFCYDVLLYLLNPDLLGFMAHDGCLFSEMDPRQKSTIFKIALELTQEKGLQYFVNVGDSTLKEVLDEDNKIGILNPEERQKIKDSIILELNDENPSSWLFGTAFG